MRISSTLASWSCFLFLLTVCCTGLELSLDLDSPGQAGSCAVLRCVEDSQATFTSSMRQYDINTSPRNISRLSVFHSYPSISGGKNSNALDLGVEIAFLTPGKNRLRQLTNGIKIDGILEDGRASLTLVLSKSIDCLAYFACQLRTVDTNGEESVSLSRVHQRRKGNKEESLMSAVSKILNLVHQLDAKVTLASKSTEKLENNINTLENKVETLDKNFETKTSLVRRATERMESKMEKIENKVDDLENNLTISKLTEKLEPKTDVLMNRLGNKMGILQRVIQNGFVSFENRIKDRLQHGFEDKLDQVLLKTNEAIDSQCADVYKMFNTSFAALGRYLKQEQKEICLKLNAESQKCSRSPKNTTDAPLTTDVNQSTVDTQTAVHDLSYQVNSTAAAVIKDLFSLKRCTRGITTTLPHDPYPYHLIQPSTDSILNGPYLCDTETDGGGWIVIQRRSSGDVDFYRSWDEYKNGFGDMSSDFWLGNEQIHNITSKGSYELRVELVFEDGSTGYARYNRFSIADENSKYALTIGGYSGTARDSMARNNGQSFTTKDRDNDADDNRNCGERFKGGWWYWHCSYANINGEWRGLLGEGGMFWKTYPSFKLVYFSEMKIRLL